MTKIGYHDVVLCMGGVEFKLDKVYFSPGQLEAYLSEPQSLRIFKVDNGEVIPILSGKFMLEIKAMDASGDGETS